MSTERFADAMARRFAPVDDRHPLGRYLRDPAGFANDCVVWPAGEGLTDYQEEILSAVPREGKVAARGPHGLGKTTDAALAVLWFAVVHDALGIDWKAPTTAGAWRQLEKYLWPEIHKWAKRLRWDLLGRAPFSDRELMTLSLRLAHGEAFAVASDQAELIEGTHADAVLFTYDEAKSISPAMFDASEGAFSGATSGRTAYALAQSTPGVAAGRFYEIHARRPGLADWWARAVTLQEAVAAGRVSKDWAEKRALQWGESSSIYRNRVLGEFSSDDEDGVVPLAWVEAAQERWLAWSEAGAVPPGGRRLIGVDVARSGADSTVLAVREGPVVMQIRRHRLEDTMTTATRTEALVGDHPGALAIVDVIGVGGGVVDRLRQQKVAVRAFNASGRSEKRERSGELGFLNLRAEAWWHVRELLDPTFGADVALPPDDELTGDLVSPRWKVTAGKIQIEGKDEIRKRLGRSPDAGDAVAMVLWLPALGGESSSGDVHMQYEGMPSEGDEMWLELAHGMPVLRRNESGMGFGFDANGPGGW